MLHTSMFTALLLPLTSCLVTMAARPQPNILKYDVMEEQPVGTIVGSVRNSLPSDFVPATITVQYSLSRASNHVNIDPLNGLIRTSAVLDRELLCTMDDECLLDQPNVYLQGPNYYQVFKLFIRVVDINDNEPVFPCALTSLNISESSQVGTRITVPAAQDADSGNYGVTDYQLQPLSARQIFRIHFTEYADGTQQVSLVLLQKLDRERMQSHLITLVAVDDGSPPKTGSVSITINVIDINDNKPRFEKDQYETYIDENVAIGTSVVQLHAVDSDEGVNAQVSYTFAEDFETMLYTDLIGIEQLSGLVYVKGQLDREETSSIHVTVIATDQGFRPQSSRARLVINVADVNDNRPTVQFTGSSSSGRVVENLKGGGASIGHVTASDLDLADNALVTCRLDENNKSLFDLIQLSFEDLSTISYQLVTSESARFDRELVPRHALTVICSDRGVPALSSSHPIDVFVDDVNDNNPIFSKNSYVFHINESSPASTVIGRVEATDPDEGLNGTVTFNLLQPSDVIAVDMTSGIVTSLVAVDFESQQTMLFQVIASDQGQPPRTSRAQMKILITDHNDERPIFKSESYAFESVENQPIGTVIGRVEATDRDVNPINRRVLYSIRSRDRADALQFVELEPISGQLTVKKTLDYEHTPVLSFEIIASDSQQASMTSQCDVTINVVNLNDNDPEFVFPSRSNHSVFLDAEEIHVGQVVARLIGLDKDEGHESHLTFDLVYSDSASRSFAVDPSSGLISVVEFEPWRWQFDENQQLDAETGAYIYHLSLTVKVTDNGLPRRTTADELNLVIHSRQTTANLSRPVSTDPASSLDTSSLLIVAGGAALGATCVLIVCVAVLCVMRLYCSRTKPRRVYNCRINEVHRAPPSVNKRSQPVGASRSKNKKGVTFDLDADIDDIGQWRDQPRVSSPVLQSQSYCKTVEDCALHQLSGLRGLCNNYGSLPTSVTDGHVWMTSTLLPHCGHHQHHQPDVINSPRRTLSLPFNGGLVIDDPDDFEIDVKLAHRVPSSDKCTDKFLVGNNTSTRWSTGSLTDSGRGHSEEDDVMTALYVRVVSDPPTPATKALLESHV